MSQVASEPVPTIHGVPDIWHKTQRVLRTGVQALLSALAAWGAFAVFAPQVLAQLAKFLPGSWIVWLTGAIAFVTVIAGALAAIMAIPQVNAFLTKVGLGSVPRAYAVGQPGNGGSV